ncbi:MAG: type II toxin-antitoxin system HicB family antitoxin [Chloroflexota bacterium]|nr:type II toxin-antitoxin system HicB family antitoxin [Chloroflexota bacterium]
MGAHREASVVKEYALYLESGPRRRKTMVHVLDLLGCIAQGQTTEAALDAAPEAIRTYLRFLRQHGETVKPNERFTTVVAAHITEGVWLGYGDPTPGFAPDFQPLDADNLNVYLRRLAWLRADLLELIRDVPRKRLVAERKGGGRSIYQILDHIAGSECVYLRYFAGKVDGLTDALRAVQQSPDDLPAALTRVWQISAARLETLSAAERQQHVKHGQVTWTARRALRRMLEHDWEHLLELRESFKL